MKKTILLVEDDESLGSSVEQFFVNNNYNVKWAKNIATANVYLKSDPQVIILDWMLPDGEGVDFLSQIRKQSIHTPVIMLTARTDLVDRVVGLETGANDYVLKPFDPRELLARIRVQLRSSIVDTTNIIEQDSVAVLNVGDFSMDLKSREIFYQGKQAILTKMEFDLLKLFLEGPNRAYSREEILNKVWGLENYPTTRTVDTHILQLRSKFPAARFETIRGIGYKLIVS